MHIAHTVRDVLITLFSISGAASLYRYIQQKRGPLVRIVVFHDVPDREWFETMISTLAAVYHIITPEDFTKKRLQRGAINVLITFDDGYASWVTTALPVLRTHGCKALFFVNSGLLNAAPNRENSDEFMHTKLLIRPRAPLTWEGALTLIGEGHTIGSHAEHHHNLASLSAEKLHDELQNDKHAIEGKIGMPVTECAYPFGTASHVSRAVTDTARNVGFERGYTAISRFVDPHETFLIPRMCIESSMTPHNLKKWMNGAYDLFDMVKKICVQ